MNIEIKIKNVKSDSMVRKHIERKVHGALGRIEARINKVVVRLENETKGSKLFDGNCRIEVDIHPRGHIHVSSKGESVYDCIMRAIRKMEHAVKHDIDRHRRSSKIRHQQAKRSVLQFLESEEAQLLS